MYLSVNIKFLRQRKGISQQELAGKLNTTRSSINNYENGVLPTLNLLILISDYFRISIDTLLRINLSTLRESQLYQIEHGIDVFIKGNVIRVLATTVDSKNKDNIELVSIKAKAGYTNGYSDPEYVSQLPTFSLPFLSKEKKYRTFQISGDSMLPIPDGAWITGEFVQDWTTIKEGERYIVLTMNEGLVFKQVYNKLAQNGCFLMVSSNPAFAPYDLPAAEIREVWKFVNYISSEVQDEYDANKLRKHIESIKNELDMIKNKLDQF